MTDTDNPSPALEAGQRGNCLNCGQPISAHADRNGSTGRCRTFRATVSYVIPPAPATDEEVARMVADLLHLSEGSLHAHTLRRAADLLARVAQERDARDDEANKWNLKYIEEILLRQQAEQRAEAAEKSLAIANQGGLDLLYAIRKAIGWTDKHALSLLPDECARLKKAAARNAPIWPGKDFDHFEPGGFDGPTGAN